MDRNDSVVGYVFIMRPNRRQQRLNKGRSFHVELLRRDDRASGERCVNGPEFGNGIQWQGATMRPARHIRAPPGEACGRLPGGRNCVGGCEDARDVHWPMIHLCAMA